MDKNAIKKYAVWARRELISRVSQKAQQFGISEKNIVDAGADSVNGHLLSTDEKKQRQALIVRIKQKGYEQVIEEVAYTWFNRFSALRFMEVNGYLPSHVRVFTDDANNYRPQILTEAIHLELEGLRMERVYALKEANDDAALYKYLIITQCNALSAVLPGMFQKIADYTELLFPDNLLREGSVLEQMVTLIPEADWQDQVQIIGWLYQYYNSEPKDKVFADLKKNIKISKENIPAATQLFTPDWIVRYMVENSLGRLWIEGHPNDTLKAGWKYYLDEAEQEPEVQAQLAEIRCEYAGLKPEEIRCIDPCMGSGHILVYMFDVLMQIYEAYGYRSRDAVASIVRNNLYGLDIDDRAAQLAYFSVMMKARQYDSRFFTRGIAPNVYAICESNRLDPSMIEAFIGGDKARKQAMETIIAELHDAKEYGSILNVTPQDFSALYARVDEMQDEISMFTQSVWTELLPLLRVAEALAQKYDTVCTNPPYMNSSGMSNTLLEFVKRFYPDSKADLSTVFMEKTISLCNPNGYMSMINIPVWMMLMSFEHLRGKLLEKNHIVCLSHNGRGIFGSDFGTTSFVFRRTQLQKYKGTYQRLFSKVGDVESLDEKEDRFLSKTGYYISSAKNFSRIPGTPIAYSASERFLSIFYNKAIGEYAFPIEGIKSGDNDTFLRFWFEVENNKTAKLNSFCGVKSKWCFTTKGGAFRKWYGNIEYVIDWSDNGKKLKETRGSTIYKEEFWHMPAITWTYLTAGSVSFRALGLGMLYNNKGPAIFGSDYEQLLYFCGLLNSTIGSFVLSFICSTLTFLPGDIRKVPVIEERQSDVVNLVKKNVEQSSVDWDSFETSWDFKRHPLLPKLSSGSEVVFIDKNGQLGSLSMTAQKLSDCYAEWEMECADRFTTLKANEEELNRIFIDIYGLADELTPEVEDKDVTVRLADRKRDIRSLISYAVGCMFGRYSLDVDGLAYAGGEWDGGKYKTFPADRDNIIPICDDEYFDDDITGRFVKFIETVYGKETLSENLRFIADALGGSGQPKEVIRNYFLNDFYADHCKIYQKRPIYWLFDSGKKNGFKALIYMHRYAPDTIARMRTDYVHEQQARYHTALSDLERRVFGASGSERVKLSKQLTKLQEQIAETQTFEEKIHHLADQMIRIDLDDGVKHNYEIFGDVLAKIK